MSSSPRLGLSYLSPQQAQKHVTVNEALRRLDALVQPKVKSRSLAAEPSTPAEGDAYILATAPSGAAWGAMAAGDLAAFQDGAWARMVPQTGYSAYVEDEAKFYVRTAGGSWTTGGGFREALAANRTYYVRTDGSDSNNGLANTAGGAFLTIQKAIDVVAALDISIYTVTVQVSNATRTAAVVLKDPVGAGACVLQGDTTTPDNCIISTTGAEAIYAAGSTRWTVTGFKLQTTTSGSCVVADKDAVVTVGKVNYGASAAFHQIAKGRGVIYSTESYTIAGGAAAHRYAVQQGNVLQTTGKTITLTGTPAFSVAFAYVGQLGYMEDFGNTFSGSATGQRYSSNQNSALVVAGGGASYFPGSIAGATSTGGLYV